MKISEKDATYFLTRNRFVFRDANYCFIIDYFRLKQTGPEARLQDVKFLHTEQLLQTRILYENFIAFIHLLHVQGALHATGLEVIVHAICEALYLCQEISSQMIFACAAGVQCSGLS